MTIVRYDKNVLKKAMALRIAGENYTKISKELNVPVNTIKNWFTVGSSKDFSKSFFKYIMNKLLSDTGPDALRVLKEALNCSNRRIDLLDKAKLALRMFGTMANIEATLSGRGGQGGGDDDTGPDSIIFQQLIVQAPELADKAKRLYSEVIEGQQGEDKKDDGGHEQIKRPPVK